MDSRFHCVSEEMHCTYCPMRSQEAALHASTVVYFEVFHDAISCQLHYQQDEQLVKLHTILFECFTFPQFRTPKTQAGTGLAQSAVVCPSAAACEPLASGICGRLPTVIQHLGGLTHRTLLLIQRFRDSLAQFKIMSKANLNAASSQTPNGGNILQALCNHILMQLGSFANDIESASSLLLYCSRNPRIKSDQYSHRGTTQQETNLH